MKDITAEEYVVADGSKAWNSGGSGSHPYIRRVMQIIIFLVGYAMLWMILYNDSNSPLGLPAISHHSVIDSSKNNHSKLENVLSEASMENKTVIITVINDAWAKPGSIFDLFLESFHIGGNQTEKLLNHLVVVTWDQKAYVRCLSLHKHCYQIETNGGNFTSEAIYMTPTYLHMVWRKIEFLGSVLQMGYSFVFTDCDIMWLRDPFRHFYKDGDFQISCDEFNGHSSDIRNSPNSGFSYVKSNERTVWFYKFWFNSSEANLKTQDVLNKIKLDPLVSKKKLKFRFLSTHYFGGFCEPSRDFKKVTTMHANCCVGLQTKINDLRLLLDDWRKYMTLSEDEKNISHPSWSVPQNCRTSFQRYGIGSKPTKLVTAKGYFTRSAVGKKPTPTQFKEKKERKVKTTNIDTVSRAKDTLQVAQ